MIVHIVPTTPPTIDGLADYCYKLWQHWPSPRPDWKCLAARVPDDAATSWPEVEITGFELSGPGLQRALEEVGARTVVLHYVGHAYQRRGVPQWLPGALRGWKNRSRGRLCVMFHEVYATGTPRQSAYWLTPISKNIVVQLLKVADVWVTSCEAAAAKLVGECKAQIARGRIIPIGTAIEANSKVDFAREWPLASKNKLRVAVFGLPSSRIAALQVHSNLLRLLCEHNEVEPFSLIGKSESEPNEPSLRALQNSIAPPAMWNTHHDLAAAQISDLLRQHDIGVSFYPPSLLTKSSVYAAFCEHGLLTICRPESLSFTKISDSEMNLTLPYLANDDANPKPSFEKLHEETTISHLKAEVQSAAQGFLSWNRITQAWAQVTQNEAASGAAP